MIKADRLPYAELEAISNFSFHKGASHPEELVEHAAKLGYSAIGLCDHSTFAGVVRAHIAAKAHPHVKFLVGCTLTITFPTTISFPTTTSFPSSISSLNSISHLDTRISSSHTKIQSETEDINLQVIVYPKNRTAYGSVCRLLSKNKQQQNTHNCRIDVAELADLFDCHIIIAPDVQHFLCYSNYHSLLRRQTEHLKNIITPKHLSIAIRKHYEINEATYFSQTLEIALQTGIPCVATNSVLYHEVSRKPLQDILTCIREKKTIHGAGFSLTRNAERYMKTTSEMNRLFAHLPHAIERSLTIASECNFSLDELSYEYPDPRIHPGISIHEYLRQKVDQGAKQRYPAGVPLKVRQLIERELVLIKELGYEKYFITCEEIVHFARSKNILCQGRGAAANSAVCYCLGITSVDPMQIDVLFARFVSKARNEPPDIDIDFEHERREEVIQYIYERYGRDYAGLTSVVVTYRSRSAIREVSKAFALPLDTVDMLAKSLQRWRENVLGPEQIKELGLDPDSPVIKHILALTDQLIGFPRHLSQHVGGFIVSQRPLNETVPIQNATMEGRSIIEWNKDDIDALGMLKIDVLALGMLSCLRKAFELANKLVQWEAPLALHTIPSDCPKTFDMICRSDTLGVFQIESRAQMSMLPRLRPRCYYDLVIEVAIVRPGPIQGNMVHPYLRRRNGRESITYPDKLAERVLGKTLGVPLFQEQAMRLAIELADFTPEEAEQLRRAMAAWRTNKSVIEAFSQRIIAGMKAKGYTEDFANTCINQIRGFSEYGFPESHAASFAHLVYASSWLKAHVPAVFAAALLNSQPMGFYAPAQILADAQRHGIKILSVDVNYSDWDYSIDRCARKGPIRVGFRAIQGMPIEQAKLIVGARQGLGNFASIDIFWCKLWQYSYTTTNIRPERATLERLARADAFTSIHLSQRQALWEIKRLKDFTPLQTRLHSRPAQLTLPLMSSRQKMQMDYQSKGFSLTNHPVSFLRSQLDSQGYVSSRILSSGRVSNGSWVRTAGIVVFRQRPGTAKGIVFLTIEDEFGMMNLTIPPQLFATHYRTVLHATQIASEGRLENIGSLVYIKAKNLRSL